MPLYEVMFIVQPDREGDALEEAVFKVKEVVEKENGEVVSLKKLGKRRLAYEIKDFREGSYILAHLQAKKEVVTVLEHFFKVTEGYLRYIVVRLEEKKQEQRVEGALQDSVVAEETIVEEEPVAAPAENIPAVIAPAEELPAENIPTENASAEELPAESITEEDTGKTEDLPLEGRE